MKKLLHFLIIFIVAFTTFSFYVDKANAQQVGERITLSGTEPQFVPGEVIVKYKKGQAPRDIREKVQRRKERSRSLFGVAQNTTENIVLRIQGQDPPEEQLTTLQSVEKSTGVTETRELFQDTPQTEDDALEDIEVVTTQGTIPVAQLEKTYEELDNVEYAEPNYIRYLRAAANDKLYPQMWSLQKIQMEQAWDITQGSQDVIVAVVDGGVDYTHSDLSDNVIKGHNYIANNDDPMDDTRSSHGTHVAGTIGALSNNNIGVTGINWQVKILAIKVLSDYGGDDSTILAGIQEAADKGAKVINVSLGSRGSCPRTWQDAVDYATRKGALVVGATGEVQTENGQPENVDIILDTPTSCKGVLSVSATGPNDQRASYSYYGNTISIAAPGGDPDPSCDSFDSCSGSWITSTARSNNYRLLAGTSMATPHVSGVAALLFAAKPSLTPEEVKNILQSTADPITTDHPIGKRLNAFNALQQVASAPQPPPPGDPTNTPIPPPAATATPTQEPKRGDINGDSTVNIQDFAIWRDEFLGKTTTKTADINKDSKVDLLDYVIWVNDFLP